MRRIWILGVALVVSVAGLVGLAQPANAGQVTVGLGPPSCYATLTVVPYGNIEWAGRYGWAEEGSVTEVGSCRPGATSPVIATGTWSRYDFNGTYASGITVGGCPSAEFWLQDSRNGSWTDYYEMTGESSTVQTPQLIGINPIYTPPVPFGYDSISTRVPTGGVTLAQTDPVACRSWPTGSDPSVGPGSYPAPPFHIQLVGRIPTSPPRGGLLQTCLTVQGVLPRTCA